MYIILDGFYENATTLCVPPRTGSLTGNPTREVIICNISDEGPANDCVYHKTSHPHALSTYEKRRLTGVSVVVIERRG